MTDNELIAEFMGWESGRYPNTPNRMHKGIGPFERGISKDHLQYHTSWEWLMPVVEKIEIDCQFEVSICSMIETRDDDRTLIWYHDCEIRDGVKKVTSTSKIECVYKAVVEFIKWWIVWQKSRRDC